MKSFRTLLATGLCFLAISAAQAGDRPLPPRLASAASDPLTPVEKEAIVAWILAQPSVRAASAGHRTRVLRAWSDVVPSTSGSERRALVLVRDYDAGVAREIAVTLSSGAIESRELVGVQPSREEMAEGMAMLRADPALAAFVGNPDLVLTGGFHNRTLDPADPCSREICLDFAFMKRRYEGPARYVIVNLTRGMVVNRDFRAKPGQPARMTERSAP